MLYTNLWCVLLSHKPLKNANLNPIPNPNPNPKKVKTIILILSTKSYYITREIVAPW